MPFKKCYIIVSLNFLWFIVYIFFLIIYLEEDLKKEERRRFDVVFTNQMVICEINYSYKILKNIKK